MHSQPAHPWQDSRLTPDERARLVVTAMTVDEKFAWPSGPIAVPIPGRPPIPEGASGLCGVLPADASPWAARGTAGSCRPTPWTLRLQTARLGPA
ncbi:hypothetical protein [Streptomyces avermitilis]|uniref:hypothetical protein n=1 Tax=Streptomyces avermitilis TaxID=33903 RepID=UPI00381EE53D